MSKITEFESKKEKYVFFSIIIVLLVISGIMFYPSVKAYMDNNMIERNIINTRTELALEAKTPKEYYNMFQCSCCGQPIDKGCCGMAKQRKEHLDGLLLGGLEEGDIMHQMVKKFGFDVLMDPSQEQQIKEYIKSKAPDNPPEITIDNPKHDFGTIHQSEGIIATTFNIENTGGSDLIIENMDTSCMCTTASIIYEGIEGPEFGMSMHGDNPKNYELRIPPGETAKLKVHYDPMAHGKQKKPELKIIREVTIISNDPVDFQKKVKIELTQIP
jgi:cytochrome c-type biogenesis protein CcmH/NrfF